MIRVLAPGRGGAPPPIYNLKSFKFKFTQRQLSFESPLGCATLAAATRANDAAVAEPGSCTRPGHGWLGASLQVIVPA